MRNIQILKNTIKGLDIAVNSWQLPRSLLCESAKNGETVDGVSVVECQNSSSGSSKEFRCVHYDGVLDTLISLDQGITSGESNNILIKSASIFLIFEIKKTEM